MLKGFWGLEGFSIYYSIGLEFTLFFVICAIFEFNNVFVIYEVSVFGMVLGIFGVLGCGIVLFYYFLNFLVYLVFIFRYSEFLGLGDGGAIVIGVDDYYC